MLLQAEHQTALAQRDTCNTGSCSMHTRAQALALATAATTAVCMHVYMHAEVWGLVREPQNKKTLWSLLRLHAAAA